MKRTKLQRVLVILLSVLFFGEQWAYAQTAEEEFQLEHLIEITSRQALEDLILRLDSLTPEIKDKSIALLYAKAELANLDLNAAEVIQEYSTTSFTDLTNVQGMVFSRAYGMLYHSIADYEKAIRFYQDVLRLDEGNLSKFSTLTNMDLGILNLEIGDFERSLNYYSQAFDAAVLQEDSFSLMKIHANRGTTYRNLGQLQAAADDYLEAIRLAKVFESDFILIQSNFNLGNVFFDQGAYAKAQPLFEEVLSSSERDGNQSGILYAQISLASLHLKKEDYEQCLNYLNAASKNMASLSFAPGAKVILELYRDYYQATGDSLKQNDYQLRVDLLADSLLSSNTQQQLLRLQSDYEIALQKSMLENKELRIQQINQRYKAYAIGAVILILLLTTTYIYNDQKKRFKIELYKKNLEILKGNGIDDQHQERDELFTAIVSQLSDPSVYADTDLTLEKLAKEVGSNTKYVSDCIRKHGYVSFYEFINLKRSEYLRSALLKESKSVTIKSFMVNFGFKSSATLNKYFKQLTGLTPKAFLEETRRNQP